MGTCVRQTSVAYRPFTNGQTGGKTDRQADKWTDGRKNGQTSGQMDRSMKTDGHSIALSVVNV